MSPATAAALGRLTVEAGVAIRDERLRRGWTLRDLADRAGVAVSVVHRVESGGGGSLESYARLGTALAMRPALGFETDPSRRAAAHGRVVAEDFVHAAMAEAEARALARPARTMAIDEPYQHYQFAGRADLLAWADRDLLHVENRTRFPNLQDAIGSYNAKRRYLAAALGERLGIGPQGWRSVTHVIAGLWSSEVLHVLRLRPATFRAVCPDPPDAFEAWLRGAAPPPGVSSSLVVLDPAVPPGDRRRWWMPVGAEHAAERIRPRHRGYAEAAEALRRRR